MKRAFFFLAFLLAIITAIAQSPQAFNYQAILRNSDGTVKVNETIALQISIVNEMGSPTYMEVHNTQTNEFGLVNVIIGQGTTSDDLSAIDWANGPYFIDITVNGENLGSSQLLSVPYALYAASGNEGPQGEMGPQGPQGEQGPAGPQGEPVDTKWEDNAGDISYVGGNVGIGTSEPDAKLHVEGDLHVSGNITTDGDLQVEDLIKEIQMLKDMTGIGTVTDIDGNTYRTVKIGDQVWMAENLKTTNLTDGTPIIKGELNEDLNSAFGEYFWYDNDSTAFEDKYGKLYLSTLADDSDMLCPSGWHVPSLEEWNILTEYLGGSTVAGGKMKEVGTVHWNSPNVGATNESGFSARPGGYIGEWDDYSGPEPIFRISFMGEGSRGIWALSDIYIDTTPYTPRQIFNNLSVVEAHFENYAYAVSVRCIKDSP